MKSISKSKERLQQKPRLKRKKQQRLRPLKDKKLPKLRHKLRVRQKQKMLRKSMSKNRLFDYDYLKQNFIIHSFGSSKTILVPIILIFLVCSRVGKNEKTNEPFKMEFFEH